MNGSTDLAQTDNKEKYCIIDNIDKILINNKKLEMDTDFCTE